MPSIFSFHEKRTNVRSFIENRSSFRSRCTVHDYTVRVCIRGRTCALVSSCWCVLVCWRTRTLGSLCRFIALSFSFLSLVKSLGVWREKIAHRFVALLLINDGVICFLLCSVFISIFLSLNRRRSSIRRFNIFVFSIIL